MKYLPSLVLLVFPLAIVTADDSGRIAWPPVTSQFAESNQPADLAGPQGVTNSSILGPTGELLPPFMATQLLSGWDYVEWCLRWNKQQYELAAQRAIPPQRISGWVTNRSAFSQGVLEARTFGRLRSAGSYHSTTQSHERLWDIGGYGGGPVTIYNPFVAPNYK